MAEATDALLTVTEFKNWLGIDVSDTSKDTQHEYFINSASKAIEAYTGRLWVTPASAIVEKFHGTDTDYFRTDNVPIGTITSIHYRDSAGDNWTSITGDWSYENMSDLSGKVYTTDGNIFHGGHYNWKITYTYGYAKASIPADMKMACAIWAGHLKKLFEDKIFGVNSRAFGDQSITYDFNNPPKGVRPILEKYKKVNF